MTKEVSKILQRKCADCGELIKVIIYTNKSYQGGHYFGKLPYYSHKAQVEALKAGFTKWKFGKTTLFVNKKDPIPYKYIEHWECPKCYLNK